MSKITNNVQYTHPTLLPPMVFRTFIIAIYHATNYYYYRLSIRAQTHLPTYLTIYLSTYLLTYLPTYSPTYLPTYLHAYCLLPLD